MSDEEMLESWLEICRAKLERATSEEPEMVLVLPRKNSRAQTCKLFGRHGGPVGEIVATHEASVVAFFKVREVMAAIENLRAKLREERMANNEPD